MWGSWDQQGCSLNGQAHRLQQGRSLNGQAHRLQQGHSPTDHRTLLWPAACDLRGTWPPQHMCSVPGKLTMIAKRLCVQTKFKQTRNPILSAGLRILPGLQQWSSLLWQAMAALDTGEGIPVAAARLPVNLQPSPRNQRQGRQRGAAARPALYCG